MSSYTHVSTAVRLRSTVPAAPRSRPLRLTARGRRLVLLVVVLLLLGAFAVIRSAASQATEQASPAAPVLAQVTVQRGETLWAVAQRVAPQRDPRDLVAQLQRLNHLSSPSLRVGQQLLLPAVV